MIDIIKTKEYIVTLFRNYNIFIDDFKVNELVFIHIDFINFNDKELCIELHKEWVGVTILDKSLKIDFSSNDEVFTTVEDLNKSLRLLKKII